MTSKDQELIAEAYGKIYIKEGMEDKNYIPSLEEIKDFLHSHYKAQAPYYASNPDLIKAKVSNLDKTAKVIKQIIDDARAETTEWNHKYAGEGGREPYTVWDDLYSSVSDDYKDLHGFRHRTTFAETPIIPMAMIFKDIQDEFRARREKRDLDWAGGMEQDKDYDEETNQLYHTIDADKKVTNAINDNLEKGELSLRKALTDIIDSYKDKGDEHTLSDARDGVKAVVKDAIKEFTSQKAFDKADLLSVVLNQL